MPFKSRAQQKFMYSQHPAIAKRWQAETPAKALPAKLRKKRAKPSKRARRPAPALPLPEERGERRRDKERGE